MKPVEISISITWMHFLRKKKPVPLAPGEEEAAEQEGRK